MWKLAVTLLSLSGPILGALIFHCPEGTTCPENGSVISPSFQFLDKLGPKQFQTITKLSTVNASLSKLPAELKYMKNLVYLDLSGNTIQLQYIPSLINLKTLKLARNNIKDIIFSLLPKNIEDLDLSNNLLSQIPKDWSTLKGLKTLHLQKNPLDCDCYNDNILNHWKMTSRGVNMPEPVICAVPKHVAGKNIDTINCSIDDDMINDQPEEGSGSHGDANVNGSKIQVPYLQEEDEVDENEIIDDQNYLPVEDVNMSANTSAIEEPEEGSGDEGSGIVPDWNFDPVIACIFNCSTPVPVGVDDGKDDTGPGLEPTDQMKIIAEDVFQPIFENPTPSTTTASEPTSTISSSPTTSSSEVSEEIIVKKSNPAVYKELNNNDVEILSNDTRTGEMEKATALNQKNYAVYVVVVCGLLLAIIFSVCLVKKRQTKRLNKKRRELPSGFGEEMKPLEKSSIQPINEKNGKPMNNTAEQIPLVNGQNGKARDEPVLKSYIPLEHPESTLDLNHDTDPDEPVLRPKHLLTPMTERVTIRASENPESIPKTPVFVHRQKNSEGEIVTTVVPP